MKIGCVHALVFGLAVSGCPDPPALTTMVRVDVSPDGFWFGPDTPCVEGVVGADLCTVDLLTELDGSDLHPPVRLTIDSFWLDAHEVTNAQYRYCVEAGACTRPLADNGPITDLGLVYWDSVDGQFDNHPVVLVTQQQAADYCGWVGKRLPTEHEWERAAKGSGDTRRRYPVEALGDDLGGCVGLSLGSLSCGGNGSAASTTTPTNDYVEEPGGRIFSLFGGVSEWTSSLLHPEPTCTGPLPGGCEPAHRQVVPTPVNLCQGQCNVAGQCDDWGSADGTCTGNGDPTTSAKCYYRCADTLPTPVCQGLNPQAVHRVEDLAVSATEAVVIKGGSADTPQASSCSFLSSARDMYVRRGLATAVVQANAYVGFRCALDGDRSPPTAHP